jgi:hypothetical protein
LSTEQRFTSTRLPAFGNPRHAVTLFLFSTHHQNLNLTITPTPD